MSTSVCVRAGIGVGVRVRAGVDVGVGVGVLPFSSPTTPGNASPWPQDLHHVAYFSMNLRPPKSHPPNSEDRRPVSGLVVDSLDVLVRGSCDEEEEDDERDGNYDVIYHADFEIVLLGEVKKRHSGEKSRAAMLKL